MPLLVVQITLTGRSITGQFLATLQRLRRPYMHTANSKRLPNSVLNTVKTFFYYLTNAIVFFYNGNVS